VNRFNHAVQLVRAPEEVARGGQTLTIVPALAALLDEGIARGEGHLDVAAGVRVPTA
jgi:hypothetical protein